MKKILIVSTAFLWLCGCRVISYSHSTYARKLSPWIGKNVNTLYAEWGAPATSLPIDGNTTLITYYQSESQPIDNDFQPYESEMSYDAMAVPNYGLPTPPPLFYCQTSFTVRNSIIIDYSFNGDDCF